MSLFKIVDVLFESLFRAPATVKYPFAPRTYYPKTRGSIQIEIKQCIYCGICQRKCPTAAIAVSKPEKKWTIDRLRCISCNACVEVCPKKCLAMSNQYTAPTPGQKKDVFQDA